MVKYEWSDELCADGLDRYGGRVFFCVKILSSMISQMTRVLLVSMAFFRMIQQLMYSVNASVMYRDILILLIESVERLKTVNLSFSFLYALGISMGVNFFICIL